MATNTIIDIPKITFGLANPDEPSFLATLPPEIRNRIYGFLFERDEPVLLHDGKAYREHLREMLFENLEFGVDDDTNEGAAMFSQQEAREIYIEQYVKDVEFKHGFGECVGLLLSCRQVYHEAVGILYGHNTFLFSRVLNQEDDIDDYDQTKSAITWMTSIGSHFALLSQVQIDADANYMGPPGRQVRDHVVHTGRFLENSIHHSQHSLDVGHRFPTNVMNNSLVTLGKSDALNIKQYATYARLLASVELGQRRDGIHAYVTHRSSISGIHHQDVIRSFAVSDEGKKTKWCNPESPFLLRLPHNAMCLIHTYASTSNTGVVVDLNSKTVSGLEMGLRGVNRSLENGALRFTNWEHNDATVKMTSQKATTSFNNFLALNQWTRLGFSRNLIRRPRSGRTLSSTEIVLNFELSTPSALEDLRININSLLVIPLLQKFQGDLVISLLGPNATLRGFARFAWRDLQFGLFLLLSDVLEEVPSKATNSVPRIWINGHGTILRATYAATATSDRRSFPYRYAEVAEADVRERGYRKIIDVGLAVSPDLQESSFKRSPRLPLKFLLGTWNMLRDTRWPDWRSR